MAADEFVNMCYHKVRNIHGNNTRKRVTFRTFFLFYYFKNAFFFERTVMHQVECIKKKEKKIKKEN